MADIIINTGHALTSNLPNPVAGGTEVRFRNNSGAKVMLVALDRATGQPYKLFEEGAVITVGEGGPHRRTLVEGILPGHDFDLYVLCGDGLQPPIHAVKH